MTRIPPSEVSHGIRIGAGASDDPDQALVRVRVALRLIHDRDPTAWSRVARSIRWILVTADRRTALAHSSRFGLCRISDSRLLDPELSTEELACALVRQGMKEHLQDIGIRDRPGQRAVFAVLNAMAWRAFALKLSEGADQVSLAVAAIERFAGMSESEADAVWNEQARRALKGAGVPDRWAERLGRVSEEKGG